MATQAVIKKYGVKAFPTNYIVGPDGKVKARFVGFDERGVLAAIHKLGVKD